MERRKNVVGKIENKTKLFDICLPSIKEGVGGVSMCQVSTVGHPEHTMNRDNFAIPPCHELLKYIDKILDKRDIRRINELMFSQNIVLDLKKLVSCLPISVLEFELIFTTDSQLPSYKGSMLRGILGRGLKRLACYNLDGRCNTCNHRVDCNYYYLFESTTPENSRIMRKFENIPRPFIIEVSNHRKNFKSGTALNFKIILIGRAINLAPYFISAFMNIQKYPLGKKDSRAVLDKIWLYKTKSQKELFYSRNKSSLSLAPLEPKTRLRWSNKISTNRIRLEFVQPTRIKKNGRYSEDPDFVTIVRSLYRRISALSYFHGGFEPAIDIDELSILASRCRKLYSTTEMVSIPRYSNRQQRQIDMCGFVGSMLIEGETLPTLMPLLRLGEILHVGNSATFGFGKYIIKGV